MCCRFGNQTYEILFFIRTLRFSIICAPGLCRSDKNDADFGSTVHEQTDNEPPRTLRICGCPRRPDGDAQPDRCGAFFGGGQDDGPPYAARLAGVQRYPRRSGRHVQGLLRRQGDRTGNHARRPECRRRRRCRGGAIDPWPDLVQPLDHAGPVGRYPDQGLCARLPETSVHLFLAGERGDPRAEGHDRQDHRDTADPISCCGRCLPKTTLPKTR